MLWMVFPYLVLEVHSLIEVNFRFARANPSYNVEILSLFSRQERTGIHHGWLIVQKRKELMGYSKKLDHCQYSWLTQMNCLKKGDLKHDNMWILWAKSSPDEIV